MFRRIFEAPTTAGGLNPRPRRRRPYSGLRRRRHHPYRPSSRHPKAVGESCLASHHPCQVQSTAEATSEPPVAGALVPVRTLVRQPFHVRSPRCRDHFGARGNSPGCRKRFAGKAAAGGRLPCHPGQLGLRSPPGILCAPRIRCGRVCAHRVAALNGPGLFAAQCAEGPNKAVEFYYFRIDSPEIISNF